MEPEGLVYLKKKAPKTEESRCLKSRKTGPSINLKIAYIITTSLEGLHGACLIYNVPIQFWSYA